MLNLTHYGVISVSGIDAEKFLQGQFTCDMREVTEQQSRLGAYCDHKGRIQVTFRIFKLNSVFYLRLLKSLIPSTLKLLQKYGVFSKVQLKEEMEWFVLGSTEFCDAPEKTDETQFIDKKLITRVPGTTPRFEILSQQPSAENADQNAWTLLDIQAGIPTIYPETVGLFTPHQINYDLIHGVSFNKGCYTGQEIVARMHFLGKSKQQLFQASFQSTKKYPPGTIIYNKKNQAIGELVDSAVESANQFQALVVLPENAVQHPVFLENSTGPVLALRVIY